MIYPWNSPILAVENIVTFCNSKKQNLIRSSSQDFNNF